MLVHFIHFVSSFISLLFHSVLYCFIQFFIVPFSSLLFHSGLFIVSFNSLLIHSVLYCFIQFFIVSFSSLLFHSVSSLLFHSCLCYFMQFFVHSSRSLPFQSVLWAVMCDEAAMMTDSMGREIMCPQSLRTALAMHHYDDHVCHYAGLHYTQIQYKEWRIWTIWHRHVWIVDHMCIH
jgi:hypothetical protein